MTKTHFAKMLALMPVVALAAACSGVTPSGSTDVAAALPAADSGEATSTAARPCANITDVSLRIDNSSKTTLWVVATYQAAVPGIANCPAPKWLSDRQGIVIDRANPFRAGFSRTSEGVANVTAVAPNGVRNTIRLDFGPAVTLADPDAATAACKLIDKVDVVTVPATSNNLIAFEARYGYSAPTTAACPIAPRWSANRAGLTVAEDGFHASISRISAGRETVVTATAPNRVFGRVAF